MPFNPKSLRNLPQYRDMADEDFNKAMDLRMVQASENPDFEARIEATLRSFAEDYDLDDLKVNDMMTLRALAQALITLNDLENYYYELRTSDNGITGGNLTLLRELHKQMSDLRSDISKLQDDLKIVRKTRQSDKAQSILEVIEDLKQKARKFYAEKMVYIFCPKCNLLISTIWTMYSEEEKNELTLRCNKKQANDEPCGHTFTVQLSELVKDGTNKPEILPDTLK